MHQVCSIPSIPRAFPVCSPLKIQDSMMHVLPFVDGILRFTPQHSGNCEYIIWDLYIYIYTHFYICIYIYIIFIYIYTYMYIYICVCIYVYIYIHLSIYLFIYLLISILYIYRRTHRYVYIYMSQSPFPTYRFFVRKWPLQCRHPAHLSRCRANRTGGITAEPPSSKTDSNI